MPTVLAVLVELLPEIIGAALAPFWVIAVLLLLASPRGLAKAAAFVCGMTLVRLLQGFIFGYVFGLSPEVAVARGPSPVVSTLLLLAGIVLLITSFRTWRKEDDPDTSPQWLHTIAKVSPLKALGIGALMTGIGMKLWVFTLAALGVISAARLTRTESVLTYLLYVLFAQTLLIMPIIASAIAPRKSASLLKQLTDWLLLYNQPITAIVTLIFGVYFTWQGISGLLA